MFRDSGSSRGRGGGYRNFGNRVPPKGLFADGIWQCNCEPRLPAEHFQTKNGSKNHGRWFYTCQKTQPKRCDFFLWDDDAKPREAAAVLNNSRSEPHTPQKNEPTIAVTEPTTPYTPSKPSRTPRSPLKEPESPDETFYDWPDSEDDELVKTADRIAMPPPPETPRKALRLDALSTPGKRTYNETGLTTPFTKQDDVFTTPSTSLRGMNLFATTGLPSPSETPSPHRFKDVFSDDSEMAKDILDNLRDLKIDLTVEAIKVVKVICNKQILKTKAIEKGRDISRQAIKAKDVRITELQAKIAALEMERETNRTVIRHLKRENDSLQPK